IIIGVGCRFFFQLVDEKVELRLCDFANVSATLRVNKFDHGLSVWFLSGIGKSAVAEAQQPLRRAFGFLSKLCNEATKAITVQRADCSTEACAIKQLQVPLYTQFARILVLFGRFGSQHIGIDKHAFWLKFFRRKTEDSLYGGFITQIM